MNTEVIKLSTPLKFLVVDDSRAIQAIIRRAISNCGYEPIEVQTAIDGDQALDVMESFVPDLVITDWHMPKVSGLELLQALRQMGHTKLRVGFVTTEKTPSMLEEAISNGAMFILHKPFNDQELVEVVTAAVKDLVQLAPAAGGEVQRGGEPIPPPSLEAVLHQDLGNLPFRLIPGDKMVKEKLTVNNLLGLYGSTTGKGVYAIGVMDANAVCMVGGGLARKTPVEVRAAMATGNPDELMLAKAHEFLAQMADCMTQTAKNPTSTISLAKASIVKNTFSKLLDVLEQTDHRSDFRISIPGYGEGRMAFFVMTTFV